MEMLEKTNTSNAFLNSELFTAVQSSELFPDSKTFADAIPKLPFAEIENNWVKQSRSAHFKLADFVAEHFNVPLANNETLRPDTQQDALNYIQAMWPKLHRHPDAQTHSTLIPLPHSYVIPGGRFQEIYYWDSYFTALGLCHDGHHQWVLDMFLNFQYLLQDNGCIPNGNRDYYRGRTQPPIMALLLDLLLSNKTQLPAVQQADFLTKAVDSLEQEYRYWMQGADALSPQNRQNHRCVLMSDGAVLNRYWDEHTGPRPESWREDLELASALPETVRSSCYTHIRAACESGWDFSSRWLAEPDKLETIRTADIVPVDLNCLLWQLETSLAHYSTLLAEEHKASQYKQAAQQRARAIQRWFWQESQGFYMDYAIVEDRASQVFSLAGVLPLFVGIATTDQARQVANKLRGEFLNSGGLVTTLTSTPQQWDSPNGWAPLQWFSVIAMENYGEQTLANEIMDAWLGNVELCLATHGCMLEKYDVVQPGTVAGGGEYQVQTGFGWTNGVSRAFYKKRHQR